MSITIRYAALLTLSIGSVISAQAPKPVAGTPYQYWDVLEADGGARKIYLRNDSPGELTISQVVIQRCENTRQLCGTYPANLVVPPGKTVVAFKIERLDAKLGWSVAYSFRAHGEGSVSMNGAPPPGNTFVRGSDGTSVALQHVPIDSLAPDVAAADMGASCGNVSVPDLPAGHRLLLMVFGTATQPTARRVMVRLDANGSAYDYTDVRHDPDDVSPDARSTQITLDLVRQSAMVRNSGGGKPATMFRATGPTLLTATSLSNPGEMIAKIVKECGGRP